MPQLPNIWLSREELRALRRQGQVFKNGKFAKTEPPRLCLYCTTKLTNGRAVCSDECDNGWWNVVPTIDGSLFE